METRANEALLGPAAGSLEGGGSGANVGEAAFAAFEAAIHTSLGELVGHPLGGVSVKGKPRRLPANKLVIRKQPWFGPACRAAKAQWRARVFAGDTPDRIREARAVYRKTCRR